MAEAFVPLSFAPGEAHKFDWSHEVVLIIRHNCIMSQRLSTLFAP